MIDESLSYYPEDGELIRYKAVLCRDRGDEEEAERLYGEAVNLTRNGFVWREAEELYGIKPAEYEEQDEEQNEEA